MNRCRHALLKPHAKPLLFPSRLRKIWPRVAELIAEKAFRKTTATTAEDTAKAPSVEVPLDFEDF